MIPFYDDVDERALLRDVYPHLQDEESRKIYLARSIHSLTDDWEVLHPIVRNMVMGKVLRKAFEEHQAQDWVLFGAGRWGQAILHSISRRTASCSHPQKLMPSSRRASIRSACRSKDWMRRSTKRSAA